MYENLKIHARTQGGEALCGKALKKFERDEILLLFPYWEGVTCSACNEQRVLIKTNEDLAYANRVLSRL
jgi:hypothetical protein